MYMMMMEDDDEATTSSGSKAGGRKSSSYNNPRASRNLAEKQRRDNLNTHIATMAALVPTVANGGSRKKDKISVLRLTAAHLRLSYTLGNNYKEFLPRRFNDIDLEDMLLESAAGCYSFLLLLTSTGKIVYVSRHVEKYLGHDQIDLIGETFYNYVYREDHEELARGISPEGCFLQPDKDALEDNSNSSDDSDRLDYTLFREQRRLFNIRVSQRTNSRRETVQYEYLQCSGTMRLSYEAKKNLRPRKDNAATSNDIIFVGTARLLKKRTITELSLLEANKNEYFTRHLIDGRILFCDHRISIVAGYMSEEVSGASAFKFMHKDDVRWTIVALRHMYDKGKSYGSSCYRLMTKTGDFIYLRTHGYLEFDEATQSVCSFICINTLTSPEEGEELIAEMKKRYSAIISTTSVKALRGFDEGFDSGSECSSTNHGGSSLEDSSQLDDAITQLLSDLPSPVTVPPDERRTPSPLPNPQLVKAAIYSQQLPPVSIHASKIGIKDIENHFSLSGKGGKGKPNGTVKKNPNETSPSRSKKNGDRSKMVAEKRMPELDDRSSPSSTHRNGNSIPHASTSAPPTDQMFTPPVPPDLEVYQALARVESALEMPQVRTNNPMVCCIGPPDIRQPFDVPPDVIAGYLEPGYQPESSMHHVNLKRPYHSRGDFNDISPKKVASDTVQPTAPVVPMESGNPVDLQLLNVNEIPRLNAELDFSAYMQPPENSFHGGNNDYPMLNSDTIGVAEPENPYLVDYSNYGDDQLLNASIENNPDIIKLFPTLPSTLNFEGNAEDLINHEFPSSDDQGAVVQNDARRAHLQVADSMSSCESQFSDIDESNLQSQCDSYPPTHIDNDIQDQNLTGLQLNVQHDIGV